VEGRRAEEPMSSAAAAGSAAADAVAVVAVAVLGAAAVGVASAVMAVEAAAAQVTAPYSEEAAAMAVGSDCRTPLFRLHQSCPHRHDSVIIAQSKCVRGGVMTLPNGGGGSGGGSGGPPLPSPLAPAPRPGPPRTFWLAEGRVYHAPKEGARAVTAGASIRPFISST